jgi:hypothetical protein
MSSMAALAFLELSKSLAAFAARSNPSGSNPVTLALLPEGGPSGVMVDERDCSLFCLLRPPNILNYFSIAK